MNAVKFRKYLPVFEEELVLNVCYETDKYRVLPMVARKNGKLYMWELSMISEEEEERRAKRYRKPKTNRAMHKENFGNRNEVAIRYINIGGQELGVSSSTGSYLRESWNDNYKVLLMYFLQNGVKLGKLETVPFEKLCIREYEIYETENERPYEADEKPKVRWKLPKESEGGITVSLKTDTTHVEIPVHKRLKLKFGEYKKPRVIRINDGDENMEVYIHGMSRYDSWVEEEKRFDDPRYTENFSAEQLEEFKIQHRKAVEATCPKGYVIPLIEYECDKDYQMQFYSSEYLRREHQSSNTSVIMMFKPDKKVGPLGYLNRVCALEAVPTDNIEDLAVELFMYYKIIEPKAIECTSVFE